MAESMAAVIAVKMPKIPVATICVVTVAGSPIAELARKCVKMAGIIRADR